MGVIKSFINIDFWIQVYQKIAKPQDDRLIYLETRWVASNISQSKKSFQNENNILSDNLIYSEIPNKIRIRLNDETLKKEFSQYKLKQNSILEVWSYFFIRKKLDFNNLKLLVKDINEIESRKQTAELTLFSKIESRETNLLSSLDNALLEKVAEDVLRNNKNSHNNVLQEEIIEISHPSKLEEFYLCDDFSLKFKWARKATNKKEIVINRWKLYQACTKYIFDSLWSIYDKNDAKLKIYKLQITWRINWIEKTYGNFLQHIVAEIDFKKKKYFRINGNRYLLKNNLLEQFSKDAKERYESHQLKEDIMVLPRGDEINDEWEYNKLYQSRVCYYVLDKIIDGNIELCDILHIQDGKIYFIHVKNWFDAKMRDLYIQVILSAKRLFNDLKNNEWSSYLKQTLIKYNQKNPEKTISLDIVEKLRNRELKAHFVMAFKNNSIKWWSSSVKIQRSRSNIAKYALIQVISEMQQFSGFEISVFDISELGN